ncbi:hypothetical protein DYB30_005854, partial [Aphanomyces astaci]
MTASPMSGANSSILTHRYMYGLKGTVKNNIAFCEENVVVYPCGHCMVIHSIETKEQQFLHGMESGTSGGFTAMAVSANRKYGQESHLHRHVSLAFSGDGKYLVGQGGAPEWNLMLWSWEKAKVVTTFKAAAQYGSSIGQVDFCPTDSNSLCVSGNGTIKFFKVTDGFVCGGSGGVVRIYEKSDDSREHFKRTKVFSIDGNPQCIQHLAISPSEDTLICSLENNQLYMLTLSSTDILKEDAMNFELVSTAFHRPGQNGAHITGYVVFVASLWNYSDKSTDILKFFKEEALAVALHPSGLHVVVAFTDKLRMLNILMDDIRPYREFGVKACREVRFSHGGQYFAVANNNTIQVYGTYSGELMAVLRGHTNQVNSLLWKADDRKLMSCGSDGSIFQWDLRSAIKVGEGPLAITTSQQFLFAGTAEPHRPGCIRAYKLPLEPESSYSEFQCHDMAVARLRLSHDNQYLFSVGDDGSLCIFETKELSSSKLKGRSERENAMAFAEEILVTKSDLEEKNQTMQELKAKVDELTLHNEYQLRLKDMNYKEKIQEVSDKFTSELTQDKQRCTDLQEDKREMEAEYDAKLSELEATHTHELDGIRDTYFAKIKAEVERYDALTQERDEENARWDEENQLLVESHTQFLAEMTSEYDRKVEGEQTKQTQLGGEKDEIVAEFEDNKTQIEEDADLEIEEVKAKYDAKFLDEREATLRLKGANIDLCENGIMKKKFTALQKDIEDQKEEIRSLQEKGKELYENIKGLEKDIQGHKKEIREREETIQDKEKRIYDLKKKNQELEKFKFVLDYKIKELKRQIEPRENEIADMKLQIEEMDQELEHYHKSNAALDLMIGELTLKMDGMQKDINHQSLEIKTMRQFIRQFQSDLHDSAQLLEKKKALKAS